MPNPSEIERKRMEAWINDEQAAKIEQLEQHLRDVALQFNTMAQELVDVQTTLKRVVGMNIQLLRGFKELDETCVRRPTIETP